jgi:hypothetical protein
MLACPDVDMRTSLGRAKLRWRSAVFIADRNGVDHDQLPPDPSSRGSDRQGQMQPNPVAPGEETDSTPTPGRIARDDIEETLQLGPVSDLLEKK